MKSKITIYFSVPSILFFLFLTIGTNTAFAQTTDIRMYAFGHSLIDFGVSTMPTPSDETTIMHWIHDIAQEAEYDFAASGQYGFLNSHVNLPPNFNWGYDNVPGVWEDSYVTFGDADINTILLTAGNFIQYQPSNESYPLNESTTVVELTETIFDWVHEQEETANYYIYANWPEMDLQSAFPPTPPLQSEIDHFHTSTIGTFTDWWVEYQDHLLTSRPELNTRLIPVGSIISKIHTQIIPNQIPFDELYEDSDPHGRATTYFLAGMITYMAIFETEIPESYMPSDLVHEVVRNNLTLIRDFIWSELLEFNLPNGESRVFIGSPIIGIEETDRSADEISIVPNPSSGHFKIIGDINNHTISLLDIHGQLIQIITTISPSGIIDISSLPNGLYFIQIRNKENGNLLVKRSIKLK